MGRRWATLLLWECNEVRLLPPIMGGRLDPSNARSQRFPCPDSEESGTFPEDSYVEGSAPPPEGGGTLRGGPP